MSWRPWRRRLQRADEKVRVAEGIRDRAVEQRCRADEMGQRVDRVSSSLEKIREENHIGPLIESILRGQ